MEKRPLCRLCVPGGFGRQGGTEGVSKVSGAALDGEGRCNNALLVGPTCSVCLT